MSLYDQWKTASPYEDFPDWIDEAESWLKRTDAPNNEDEAVPIEIIKGLLEVLEDEGIYKPRSRGDIYMKAYRAGWNDAFRETKALVEAKMRGE